jgi:hypothetical protein
MAKSTMIAEGLCPFELRAKAGRPWCEKINIRAINVIQLLQVPMLPENAAE